VHAFFFLPGALIWLEACVVCDMAELTMLSGDVTEIGVGFCFANLMNVIKDGCSGSWRGSWGLDGVGSG
jgi:hypothetical protein